MPILLLFFFLIFVLSNLVLFIMLQILVYQNEASFKTHSPVFERIIDTFNFSFDSLISDFRVLFGSDCVVTFNVYSV